MAAGRRLTGPSTVGRTSRAGAAPEFDSGRSPRRRRPRPRPWQPPARHPAQRSPSGSGCPPPRGPWPSLRREPRSARLAAQLVRRLRGASRAWLASHRRRPAVAARRPARLDFERSRRPRSVQAHRRTPQHRRRTPPSPEAVSLARPLCAHGAVMSRAAQGFLNASVEKTSAYEPRLEREALDGPETRKFDLSGGRCRPWSLRRSELRCPAV